MVMASWDYARRADYRINADRKPTVFLYGLRGLMGERAFDRAMYAYASKQRFRHPKTADFVAAVLSSIIGRFRSCPGCSQSPFWDNGSCA